MQEQAVHHLRDAPHRSRAALLTALLLMFAAALPATGDAQQLAALINLRDTPSLPPTFIPLGNAVTQLSPLAVSPHAANDGTFFMTTVKVDLTGFTQACFTLTYGTTPVDWTFHVGDDSTNNGFGGGGPGLSTSVAEVQILGQILRMFSIALGPGVVSTLDTQLLALGPPSAFMVCVGNALVTWGNPFGSDGSTQGFQIPDLAPATPFSLAGDGNRDIFAGFNRVVNGTFRNGVGLARVLIELF